MPHPKQGQQRGNQRSRVRPRSPRHGSVALPVEKAESTDAPKAAEIACATSNPRAEVRLPRGHEPEAAPRGCLGHGLKGTRVHSPALAEVLLFHHAQGQTPGFLAFADELRAAGHTIHTPDLYDGKTFASLDQGVGHAREVGFGTILERGEQAAADLPSELAYAGFSLGVMPAQKLAQTRPGARGALLFSAAFPTSEFGGSWPQGVPLQIHMMESDQWAMEDLPAARELVETVDRAELFLYPGDRHLFADSSLADYDEQAAAQLKERVLAFLKSVD